MKKSATVSATIRLSIGSPRKPSAAKASSGRMATLATPLARSMSPSVYGIWVTVGYAAAEVVSGADSGQGYAYDASPCVQGHADGGGEYSPGDYLDDESAGAGREYYEIGFERI